MPKALIQVRLVTNCRPECPILKRARKEMAIPSGAKLAIAVARPTSSGGSAAATSAMTSGSQMRIESVTCQLADARK